MLKYIIEDVRNPISSFDLNIKELKVIGHCVNDLGVMGRGVAKALFDKWYQVRSDYINWNKTNNSTEYELEEGGIFDHGLDNSPFELGEVQFVKCENDIVVTNMIAQHDIVMINGVPPFRKEAMESCFNKIVMAAKRHTESTKQLVSIHLPYKVGCDLAGGKWEDVEELIENVLLKAGLSVTIYDVFNQRGV